MLSLNKLPNLLVIWLFFAQFKNFECRENEAFNAHGFETFGNDFGPPIQITSGVLQVDKSEHTNWKPADWWPPTLSLSGHQDAHYNNVGQLLSNNQVQNANDQGRVPYLDLDLAQRENVEIAQTRAVQISDNVDFKHE